jgi:hypothetical protein
MRVVVMRMAAVVVVTVVIVLLQQGNGVQKPDADAEARDLREPEPRRSRLRVFKNFRKDGSGRQVHEPAGGYQQQDVAAPTLGHRQRDPRPNERRNGGKELRRDRLALAVSRTDQRAKIPELVGDLVEKDGE